MRKKKTILIETFLKKTKNKMNSKCLKAKFK